MKEVVEHTIKTQLASVLSENSDVMVAKLVEQALAEKTNAYDRRSRLETSLNAAVRDAANGAVQEWIDEQRPKIAALVRKKLNSKSKGLIASVADQLVGGMTSGLDVRYYFGKACDD
jgi:hypothetical protein